MTLSPMMKHYLEIKEKYKDSIVFYRLGDFYEMFFEDAIKASKELDLTLTGRDCGLGERAPMCGLPFHAADSYISKLIEKGYKVAICEQLTEPKPGQIVERDVIRVITPGTVVDETMLEQNKNNYILSLGMFAKNENKENLEITDVIGVGVAYCDISTGEFVVEELTGTNERILQDLNDLIVRISPAEILVNANAKQILFSLQVIKAKFVNYIGDLSEQDFEENSASICLNGQFGKDYFDNLKNNGKYAVRSAGALVKYLNDTQKRGLSHINQIQYAEESAVMQLDINTLRNLELTETIRDRKKRGSLLSVLDNTSTCMGSRLFRTWLMNPSQDESEINGRLNAIEEIISNIILREELHTKLKSITDIERIAGRIAYGNFNPKDANSLKIACLQLPEINRIISNFSSIKFTNYKEKFDSLEDLYDLLEKAINENAPALTREGGIIKEGFNLNLDQYRNAGKEASNWLTELEVKERELTGIKNLKIGFNRVFGYFIEVNKSQVNNVPYRYQRKQTIANNERYITEDLKIIEEKVMGASEQALKLEISLFEDIRTILLNNLKRIQNTAKILAELDCLLSGAIISVKNNYCKPKISKKIKHIKIVGGRHPVVESLLKDSFVPNDTFLNNDTDKSMIITGPNMAGKSTYMRQVALITLMAHVGLFVPATSAEIGITDKIFTRIGASDDVSFGQSTFMVEMTEVAYILNNATDSSLAILDEIGRGTSTFDGLSIAWSVMEYITKNMKMKTLFSTHYHELTELEGVLEGVKNYRVTVKEFNDEVIFLRKIVRGGANKSFGIAVAKLAELPNQVIKRAKEISENLEKADINHQIAKQNLSNNENYEEVQRANSKVVGILKDIDINKLSPMSAFEILADLIEKVKK
ncbi:MAG: DNA mismatch repair protein MutS [Clostridia bacterium]|nr:DNA mismatch repair protein MutS [Clostridia bacterium]